MKNWMNEVSDCVYVSNCERAQQKRGQMKSQQMHMFASEWQPPQHNTVNVNERFLVIVESVHVWCICNIVTITAWHIMR